jgi:hypothetical protein
LKRIAPANAFEPLISMIHAQPLPEPWTLVIQRSERSTCVLVGASGQLENRVTSGIDSIA